MSLISRAALATTAMRQLADALVQEAPATSVVRRWGTIAAISGPPNYTVDVTVSGQTVQGLSYDAGYTPVVGEVVMLDVVGTDTVVVGTIAPSTGRTGDLEPSLLGAPKTGTLICQGQTVSRTTYANLFAWATNNGLIGTGLPFGPGDGSTNFTIPDYRGRTPIGAGTLGSDTYNIGDTPGASHVTLAISQLPSHSHAPTGTATTTIAAHTHTVSATTAGESGHTHSIPTSYYNGAVGTHNHGGAPGTVSEAANPNNGQGWQATTNGSSGHTHSVSGTSGSTTATATTTVTISEQNIGSGSSVDVRQAAFIVNWLIWT